MVTDTLTLAASIYMFVFSDSAELFNEEVSDDEVVRGSLETQSDLIKNG